MNEDKMKGKSEGENINYIMFTLLTARSTGIEKFPLKAQQKKISLSKLMIRALFTMQG